VAVERILIIKIAALGDIAVASALLSRVSRERAGARVTWLTGERGAELVRLFDGVDEIVAIDETRLLGGSPLDRVRALASAWRRLAYRRFDHVLLLHADRRYRALALGLRFRRLSSLKHGVNPLLERHRADEYARLLDGSDSRGPIVTRYPLQDIRHALPRSTRRGTASVVALVPGGARNVLRDDALRRWPAHSYAQLAARLAAAGHEVILLGDAHDVAVRSQFGGVPVTDRIGALSLTDTLTVLRDVDVLVSHDTGPLHFARLVRTPAVALFGPTNPYHVVGDDPDVTVLWGGASLACRPCYDGREYAKCASNLCLQSVTVDAVFAAVQGRIGQANPAERRLDPLSA
jgi:heptosyltransferase-2